MDVAAIASCRFPCCEMVRRSLYLVFAPALFGLIPGHLRWMHALPLEGLTGRLVVDTLVHYLNFPGAAIVIGSMVVIALYLSTTFSFSTAQQWMAVRFAFAHAWRDRFRNWRSAWAKDRAEKKAARCRERRAQIESAQIRVRKAREKPAGRQVETRGRLRAPGAAALQT